MPLHLFLAGLLLLTALGLGLTGYQAIRIPRMAMQSQVAEPPAALTVDVLVTAHNIPVGTLVREEDLARRAAPADAVPNGALIDTPDRRASLRGALLRHYLDAGAIIASGDVLYPRDRGFLAAVLSPGARAVSIGVDAISGNGGLIWPGDRVDLILTQELDQKDTPAAKRFVGETVLSDVRVVAVDQSIAQGGMASGDSTIGRIARTVTLEVTPRQSERVALAAHIGKITLAVRAAEGAVDAGDHRHSVYGSDISSALADQGPPNPPHMRVIEGKDAREVTFQ